MHILTILGQIFGGGGECLMIFNDCERSASGEEERDRAWTLDDEGNVAKRIRRKSGGYVD